MRALALSLICAILAAQPAMAAGLSPSEAVIFVADELRKSGVTGHPVPPSRAWPACDGNLTVTPMNGGGRAVSVGCDAPFWTRAIRLRDGVAGPDQGLRPAPRPDRLVLGLNRAMAKGETISENDLAPVAFDNALPDQIFVEPEQLAGRVLKQSLGPGKAVLARHLLPAHLVVEGRPVVILSHAEGFSVSLSGRAQASAAMGEFVDVLVQTSGRRITARVIGEDLVRVSLKPANSQP